MPFPIFDPRSNSRSGPQVTSRSTGPALLFRLRYRYRRPMAIVVGLLMLLSTQRSRWPGVPPAGSGSGQQAIQVAAPITDREPEEAAEFVHDQHEHSISSTERIVIIERPGGLGLAREGEHIEVIAISGVEGPIVATPLASRALVIARSDTSATIVVTKAEAWRILEMQALGSIAFLGIH